jgi:hypothetical protein
LIFIFVFGTKHSKCPKLRKNDNTQMNKQKCFCLNLSNNHRLCNIRKLLKQVMSKQKACNNNKKIFFIYQRSAFLPHLALFFYGMALFLVSGDFLNYEKKFNQTIHEFWLFIILRLFFGSFRADPCFIHILSHYHHHVNN